MRRAAGARRISLSLTNRLVLVFSAITFVAIAVLYLYVAPGLQTRLLCAQLTQLASDAKGHSTVIAQTVGSSEPLPRVQDHVNAAALATGDRVTLLLVNQVPSGSELSAIADSSRRSATAALTFAVARRAAATGRMVTGTERTRAGTVAEAADPVVQHGRPAAVIVYSAPASAIVRTVASVRHQILVAGGIALLLGLVGGYVVARALAQRVKRLELAAEKVAAGDFDQPIPVDSGDELGQLAVAFNQMQRQLGQLESARKKFIATASHELRTPIFSLGGFVELLEDEDLDPETRRRFLEQVKDQVERLRKLSVDLLDLSRLESGSLELRPEQVDLSELTRSVSGEFEPGLAQHDSHLELRVSSREDRGAVRSGPRGADRSDPDRQRARAHAGRFAHRGYGAAVRRPRPSGGSRRRRGDRSPGAGADLRAVLHRRRCAGVGAGAGHRERAGRMHGGTAVGRFAAGRDDVHARPARLSRVRPGEGSRGNGMAPARARYGPGVVTPGRPAPISPCCSR